MQEDQIAQRSKIISYILMVILVVGFAGYYMMNRGAEEDSARVSFLNEGAVVLRPASGDAITIPYSSLSAVQLEASPDYGEPVDGSAVDGLREGRWHRERYGDYVASADEGIPCAVWLQTAEDSFLVNLESEAVTKSFCQSLVKLVNGD